MGKRDIDRIIEAKYDVCVAQAITELQRLPGDVWTGFAEDIQRGHSIVFDEYERLIELICDRLVKTLPPAELELLWYGSEAHWDHDDDKPSRQQNWEEGVSAELYQRIGNAAANLDLEEDEEGDSQFSISEDEASFLSDVTEMLGEVANREQFSPDDLKGLKRTIGALKSLPNLTPGIDVRIEIGHTLGTGGFRETRTCVVEINSEHVEISSGGSQCDDAVGSDTYRLDSFKWFPDGESDRSGDTDDWLGLLSYILDTNPNFDITDNSDEDWAEARETESTPDPPTADSASCVVDRYRMDSVLWQLWTEYQRDFEAAPVREVQDLRAFAILWVATFMPELVSARLRSTLARDVGRYRDRPDYGTVCWFRTLPLEAALYALTGKDSWLDTIRFNLDHHKLSLREIVTESLALVADRLVFDAEMRKRIAHNLEVSHGMCEWPVILFAISRGDPLAKREQIRNWLESRDVRGDEREVLEKLVRGRWVTNPFLDRLLRTQQFLTLRLAGPQAAPHAEPAVQLLLLSPDQGELDLYDGSPDTSAEVWKRLTEHPLTSSLIKIEGVSPE